MSDELKAVGRLEAWIRDYGHEKQPEFIRDLRTVLDAYLAEHPADDGEPVTEEWLRSVGFDNYPFPDYGRPLVKQFGVAGRVAIWTNGVTILALQSCYEQICLCTTRDDVRRLAATLGIELKETGDGQA